MFELVKIAGQLQHYAALFAKLQTLDADGNGVMDSEQHKANVAEILADCAKLKVDADALMKKAEEELVLLQKDAEALGIAELLATFQPHPSA